MLFCSGSFEIASRYEHDSYFQSASHAKYGLNFNKNIDWDKEIVALNNFESNSYQWTGFDENAFPLFIDAEVFNCIKTFTEYSYTPEPEFYPGTDEITTESSEKIAAHFEQIEKSMDYYTTSTTKFFNFSTLKELTDFTSSCGELYALNSNLYSNLIKLLHIEKIDIFRDIFEPILKEKA